MYFPYLRGRQFELIAIRELLEKGQLSPKVIPIIEPVRASSTLIRTLSLCNQKQQPVAFIINPLVGSFVAEFNESEQQKELLDELRKDNIIKAYIVNSKISTIAHRLSLFDTSIDKALFVLDKRDYLDEFIKTLNGIKPKFNLTPDEREYRRNIRDNRVILNDSFNAMERNSDYSDEPEFFSSDHLYFDSEGCCGFSDYSIVGNKFSEAGFAPYCLVIHIVYFNENNELMIRHFSSKSNEDIKDPANKFREALESLLEWNQVARLNTYAMRQFKKFYDDGVYPGLGTVKKLSIMHHIELINGFLNR